MLEFIFLGLLVMYVKEEWIDRKIKRDNRDTMSL